MKQGCRKGGDMLRGPLCRTGLCPCRRSSYQPRGTPIWLVPAVPLGLPQGHPSLLPTGWVSFGRRAGGKPPPALLSLLLAKPEDGPLAAC